MENEFRYHRDADSDSTVNDLLWDMEQLAKLKPTKRNQHMIEYHQSNRRRHALLVRGMVFEHAFNTLVNQ